MQVVAKQKPLKKRAEYRKIASQICGTNNAAFGEKIGDKKADNIRRALLVNGKIILDKNSKKYQGELLWEE